MSYTARLAGTPVTVMGMANTTVLSAIEINLESPRQADSEAECLALRDLLGAPLASQLGSPGETVVIHKPVSVEHIAPLGSARLVVRWFPTGRSCYVTVVYGGDDPLNLTSR